MSKKVNVNENYLKLLEAGIPKAQINMYMKAELNADGPDTRYYEPKEKPKASRELVDKTVRDTEIYRRAKLAILSDSDLTVHSKEVILNAQRKQVAYGIDKYPEPLNPNTWSSVETIDHIFDESIDKLHYLVMLTIKLEQELVSRPSEDYDGLITDCEEWNAITSMIDNAIEELNYLVTLRDKLDTKKRPDDAMDAMAYSIALSGADFDGDVLTIFDEVYLNKLKEGK